ncbi:MAG: hypothetical protein ABJH45_01070 [Paracoccaceae bacterium]
MPAQYARLARPTRPSDLPAQNERTKRTGLTQCADHLFVQEQEISPRIAAVVAWIAVLQNARQTSHSQHSQIHRAFE